LAVDAERSGRLGRRLTSPLRRCDRSADQASEAADVAGGIDGVAEPDDHRLLRLQDDDALALAERKVRVVRKPYADESPGTFVLAAVSGTVI
jgi:hypothetical protein